MMGCADNDWLEALDLHILSERLLVVARRTPASIQSTNARE
jgi:hypothetical protein